jgi:hypothetical protein
MRFPIVLLPLVVLIACPTAAEPEPLEPISGTVACSDPGDGPIWNFDFAASGPADPSGAELQIFSDDVANDFAYGLQFDGSDGTARADYSFSSPGTAVGEDPAPGDIPFACEDAATVHVFFCVRNAVDLASVCWACEEEAGAPLPSGAEDWMTCG